MSVSVYMQNNKRPGCKLAAQMHVLEIHASLCAVKDFLLRRVDEDFIQCSACMEWFPDEVLSDVNDANLCINCAE